MVKRKRESSNLYRTGTPRRQHKAVLSFTVAVKELNLRPEPLPGNSPAGAGFSHIPATQPGCCWEMLPSPTPLLHGSVFIIYGNHHAVFSLVLVFHIRLMGSCSSRQSGRYYWIGDSTHSFSKKVCLCGPL
ncbi:uncharacterized protein LJ206_014144 isoform 1-T1 [Theristicus caerulescens]